MNYNERYSNNDMEWNRINQRPGSSFPSDWDYDDDDCYYEDNYENFDCYKKINNRKEDKCYYGKFMFCQKQNQHDNNSNCRGNNKNNCKKDENYQEDTYDNCKRNNRPTHQRCNCCLCRLLRNFHC